VSDEDRKDQWGVHFIDKVQHTEKAISDFQRGLGIIEQFSVTTVYTQDHMRHTFLNKYNYTITITQYLSFAAQLTS